MKPAFSTQRVIRECLIPCLVLFFAVAALPAQAQDSGIPEVSEKFSREELSQMLAPIALYPDTLLSQVLMASTYPIEVIEADRWVRKNPELTGEPLDDALLEQEWDPSVKALCHFPSILALMSERIAETTNIGNAFLAQEGEVMDMVQELRAKAYAQGNLTTTTEQKIIVEKETIIIEPADPKVVYVPYYDPYYIYGPWWYPAYPPYYWGPPGVSIGLGISYWPGFYFGFAFGSWSYFDWPRRYVYVNVQKRPRYVRHDRWLAEPGRWTHIPEHRRGVAYRYKSTAQKYGQYPVRTRVFRPETRGFPERNDPARRPGGQPGFDRDSRGTVQPTTSPAVQERQRSDSQKQGRVISVQPGRQGKQDVDRGQQMPQRIEQQRQRAENYQKARPGVEPERQRAENIQKARPGFEPERQQMRQRVENERPAQQPVYQEKQMRQSVEPEPQQRSRENVFNRVEEGRREIQSSERGRSSRQASGNDLLDRNRSGGGNRGGGGDNRNRTRR